MSIREEVGAEGEEGEDRWVKSGEEGGESEKR